MGDTDARMVILERIREARGAMAEHVSVPRTYRTEPLPGVDIVKRFVERVADYQATVHRAAADELPAVIANAAGGAKFIVTSPDTPLDWISELKATILADGDPPLSFDVLDDADGVLTGCRLGIAETGTIVLDAGPAQGRRSLSLLPDHHICVVREDQIVADVPQALPRLDPTRPMTWISGPSATSDIELNRIEGVHGPRILDVIVVAQVRQLAVKAG